jgi:hypothetical protein
VLSESTALKNEEAIFITRAERAGTLINGAPREGPLLSTGAGSFREFGTECSLVFARSRQTLRARAALTSVGLNGSGTATTFALARAARPTRSRWRGFIEGSLQEVHLSGTAARAVRPSLLAERAPYPFVAGLVKGVTFVVRRERHVIFEEYCSRTRARAVPTRRGPSVEAMKRQAGMKYAGRF